MGLLNRMLADLVGGSTGMNPRMARKMIRKIGTRNLLMMGGAAALGGLAASKAAPPGTSASGPPANPPGSGSKTAVPPRSGGSGASQPGAAPPPPPPGTAPEAPPLPPVPGASPAAPPPPSPSPETSDVDADELPPEAALPAIRTMVAAALADGELSGEERSLVVRHIEEANLPEEEVRRIREDLVLPPSPAELARLAPTPEARETLYRLAAVVLRTDQQVTDAENRWLTRLAAAFEIGEERRRELEAEMTTEE